jgi:putative MATE family efflux protein
MDLSWPVMVQEVLKTLMRTTDVIVAGAFSPAAIAAIGLADIYGRIPLWIGLGVGDGAIALTSQDTGSGHTANRNEVVSQAILVGALSGIPFVLFGIIGSFWAIEILGADQRTVRQGGLYLAIIMLITPAYHVTMIATRCIQGTGDTRTPMVVNAVANALNIVLTVVLAFGYGPFPELSIIGIAAATAVSNAVAALVFLVVIWSPRRELAIVWPSQVTVVKQLLAVSVPRVAEGFVGLVAEFPFNAILLIFGTDVNAAYHVGRRIFHQVSSPMSRGYAVATNVIVGEAIGRGDEDEAYFNGLAVAALALLTVVGVGSIMFVGAEPFVRLFLNEDSTVEFATSFTRTYAVTTLPIALYVVLVGAIRGGGETRPPLAATLSGTILFLLGITYVFGVRLGYGVTAAYVAIFIDFAWRDIIVGSVFLRKNWLERGRGMMRDRGSIDLENEE